MLPDDYTAELIECGFWEDKQRIDTTQKIYKYDDGVFWELRRLVLPTHHTPRKTFRLSVHVNEMRPQWVVVFRAFQCEFDGVMPSQKAARFWGPVFMRDKHVHQEFSVSTKGALAIVVCQTVCSKSNTEKLRWAMMLKVHTALKGSDVKRWFTRGGVNMEKQIINIRVNIFQRANRIPSKIPHR